MSLLSAVGCVGAMLDGAHLWKEYEALSVIFNIYIADRKSMEKIVSDHLSECGSAHLEKWWTGLKHGPRRQIEQQLPHMASTFKAACLGASKVSENRPRHPSSKRAM